MNRQPHTPQSNIQPSFVLLQKVVVSVLFIAVAFLATNAFAEGDSSEKLKALIVDGQNNHKIWPKTTKMMKAYLEETGMFEVTVQTTIAKGTDPAFKPDFSKYAVVVSNFGYGAAPWPDETKTAFETYMKNGGGLVVVHAADNSFPKWPAFNEMIGLGGWGGRNESSGPYVYLDADGKQVRDTSKGRGGGHGPQHEFSVVIRNSDHPITKGMPSEFLHAKDELYQQLRGPANNMTILATSFAAKKYKGTERHEPMIMTIDYDKGRIFHTPMGHADYSCECVGFINVFQRGTEWAATGKVTIPVAEDFPSADKTSVRKFEEKESGNSEDIKGVKSRVNKMLEMLSGDIDKDSFRGLVGEKQFSRIEQTQKMDKIIANFQKTKAPRLIELLESIDYSKGKFEGNSVTFPVEGGRPLRFEKTDGKWSLLN